MKHFLFILLLFSNAVLKAQLNEDFSDGDFTNNPFWAGSTGGADFTISGNKLRSNASIANTGFFLSTENTLATNVQWDFWVNLQFSTSGSNYTDIYVISDKADLKSTLINGYFVRIGNTDDEISLYKRSGTAGSSIKIIDGVNGSVGSSNNTVKVRLKRDNIGQFILERDVVASNSSYFVEGTVIDLTHTISTHFGIFIQQSTASFFLKHYFDNIKILPTVTDTIPPVLASVTNLDSNTVEITFSEVMDTISAKLTSNYSISGNAPPILKILTTSDPVKIHLELAKSLNSGNYLVSASNVRDINGNPINGSNNGSFSYMKPYIAKFGDVIINEIFADPSPQIDLPSVEFAELRNNTNEQISLKNWKFSDSGNSAIFGELTIDPHSFLIVCAKADTAEYKSFGKVHGLSPWPSLNNSGEILKLINPENSPVDSIRYSDAWYRNSIKKQGGWTLERKHPGSRCEDSLNWFASIDSAGGTPGKENSIYVIAYDILPLRVDSLRQLSDTTVKIYFNKHLNSATLVPENFVLNPNTSSVKRITAQSDFKEVVIAYNQRLTADTEYTLNIGNLKDCYGVPITSIPGELRFKTNKPVIIIENPDTAKLAITEIFADPSPEIHLPLSEFIEIYNPSKDTVDLDRWTISDPTTKATIRGQKILPLQYAILCPVADTLLYKSYGKTIGLNPWPSLNNNSDQLSLKSYKNRVVDSVAYFDNWYHSNSKRAGGWSMEKIDLNSVCRDLFNWSASIDTNGGTPGKRNSVNIAGYDTMVLQADSLKLISDTTVRIYFNKHLNSATLLIENFNLNPSNSVKRIISDAELKEVTIVYDRRFTTGTAYQMSVSNLKDCSGNSITSPQTLKFKTNQPPPPVLERIDTARILITEILADPSPEINLPLVEFIEIYNPSKDTVDLDIWTISDPTTKATIRGQKILPLQYAILCPVADTLLYKSYGKTIGLNPWPSLNNSSDQLSLKSFKNRLVDSVAYSDNWYHNSSKKAGGWSLEKIDLNSVCEDIFNWSASIDTNGGTPGKRNSVNIAGYDTMALQADSLKLISDTTVRIYFNKHLNSATLVTENFNLTPDNSLKRIISDAELKEVTIVYDRRFTTGTAYQISVSNLKDCSGYSISIPQTLKFKTNQPPPPVLERIDTARILITEIFADPSPEINLPLVEYIEIYNPSKDTLDLDKWTINDPTTKATIRGQKILPDEYIVLCPIADTLSYKSYGKTIGLNPWPSLNNNSDQLSLKSFKNRVVDSVAYSDNWYHNSSKKAGGWSLEKIDLNSVCENLFNWTASIDTNGGTPGKRNSVNIIGYDKVVLQPDSIKLISDTSVRLYFNKHFNSATLVADHFNLVPANSIKKIISVAGLKEVTITYDKKFQAGTEYQISVLNLKDCSGKSITGIHSLNFKTSQPPPPVLEKIDTARIVITEIFADPSPEIGLPLVEFIELYNPGAEIVDLNKWTVGDAGTKSVITNATIAPGEYLILCPLADTLSFKQFGKTKGIAPWPSLGNISDQIILKSFKQRMVDSISYSDKWYKNRLKRTGGWSLEKIDLLNNSCNGFYNWSSSIDPDGGTPGGPNSLKPSGTNQRQIKIDSVRHTSDSTVILHLNSIADTLHLKPSHFVIDNGIGKAIAISIEETYLRIHLTFGSKFQEGINYILTADSLFSCRGEKIIALNNRATFAIPIIPEFEYPIVINEILADPSPQIGLPEIEFVELYNPTEKPVSLIGMFYGDEGIEYKFTSGEIAAKSYLILCPEKDTLSFSALGKVLGLRVWPSLANEKDVLILKNNKRKEFQRVAYNAGWYKDPEKKSGGYSLEMISTSSICVGSQNWNASKDPSGGTPGKENSIHNNAPGEPLKLAEMVLTDSITILLTFNKTIDSLSASALNNYYINNGIGTPDSVLPLSPNFEQVSLKLKAPPARGHTYRIEVKNLRDCTGSNISPNFNYRDIILTQRIVKNAVLVNEVLFNPRAGGEDFVEIYNNTKDVLDLQDLSIATIIKDTISSTKRISAKQLLFEPGNYLTLTADPEIIKKEYRVENPDRTLKMALPPFNDDKGAVILLSNGVRIDQLNYTDKMHFQLLKNFEGVSLERSSFELSTNEAGNFRSATEASGFATPGYKNSQYNGESVGNDEFTLLSRTFSPDNDGFEDLLQVSYSMPVPGMVANVKIFNDKGIMIKNLLKNSTLNTKGIFTWDGLNDLNTAADTGIYFIYAEIFSTNGNLKRYRKSFALAVKL